jgi:type IV pilus assembly protein PilM
VSKTRIGLDVGSTAVRAAEVTGSLDDPSLVRAAQVELPPGAVENGEIKDPEAVAQALHELWRRGGFRNKQVYMAVGNQRVVVREIVVPWLPDKELRDSLPYQVQEFIPIPVEEAVLDFDVLEEFEHEGARMLRVLLVAAQRPMVQQVVEVAHQAKLEPVGVDLTAFALVRSVGTRDTALFEAAGEEAVIDVGAEITSIVVHEAGVPRFVRMLPTGGNDITNAVARALGVTVEEADRLKAGFPVEGSPVTVEDARQVAYGRAASFVDEIRSSLEFYTAQSPRARITRVLVTGGGSKLRGFVELLQERLTIPVDRAHPFQKVLANKDVDQQAEALLAVAIGLAIPGGVR